MYIWQAVYDDGTVLNQFNEEKENLFKDIDQEKLIVFNLSENGNTITVNLEQGIFTINETVFEVPELSYKEGYRLIYFRRNTRKLATGGVELSCEIESFIGYQLEVDKKNRQVMLSEKDNVFKIHMK